MPVRSVVRPPWKHPPKVSSPLAACWYRKAEEDQELGGWVRKMSMRTCLRRGTDPAMPQCPLEDMLAQEIED